MIGSIARLFFTLTALSPIGIVYAWVLIYNEQYLYGIICILFSLILVYSCTRFIKLAKKYVPTSNFKASEIEAADNENTALLLLYIMPLFTTQFDSLQWHIWIPALIIFALITGTGYNYHFNPLLGLLGWHFYRVKSKEGVTFVLITRKQLRSAADSLRVGQLTEYILIDQGDEL